MGADVRSFSLDFVPVRHSVRGLSALVAAPGPGLRGMSVAIERLPKMVGLGPNNEMAEVIKAAAVQGFVLYSSNSESVNRVADISTATGSANPPNDEKPDVVKRWIV